MLWNLSVPDFKFEEELKETKILGEYLKSYPYIGNIDNEGSIKVFTYFELYLKEFIIKYKEEL